MGFCRQPTPPTGSEAASIRNSELRHYPAVCIRDTSVNFPRCKPGCWKDKNPFLFLTSLRNRLNRTKRRYWLYSTSSGIPLLNSGKLLKKPMREHKHATSYFLPLVPMVWAKPVSGA